MKIGSRDRSAQDAAFYIAKRRLRISPINVHLEYANIECTRLVERLRAIRDVYGEHLARLGCRPLQMMQWIVFRFGVMDWALRLLRSSVQRYLTSAAVPRKAWEELYGPLVAVPLGESQPAVPEHELLNDVPELEASIRRLLPKGLFDQVLAGGPFGPDAQFHMARDTFGMALLRGESFAESLKHRQLLWAENIRWMEPLARMFDAVQEELIFQVNSLTGEGRQSEELFHQLPMLQQIAYKRMVILRPDETGRVRLGDEGWLAVMRELDENGVPLDELPKRAQLILTSLRRRRMKITSWQAAYSSRSGVSLDDGKTYTLRREVMIAIHNAAQFARLALRRSAEF